jgi:hypothetical protein
MLYVLVVIGGVDAFSKEYKGTMENCLEIVEMLEPRFKEEGKELEMTCITPEQLEILQKVFKLEIKAID